MQIDRTTLTDLGIFSKIEEESVLHLLDYTRTTGGRDWLKFFVSNPFDDIGKIHTTQQILKKFMEKLPEFPATITNGTMMVLDKYYESPIASIPHSAGAMETFFYTFFNRGDYVVARYSVKHMLSFIKGMYELIELLDDDDNPLILKVTVDRAKMLLAKPLFQKIKNYHNDRKIPASVIIEAGFYFYRSKNDVRELETIFYKMDAWYSMAQACIRHGFSFPEVVESNRPYITAQNLWHPLLVNPVGYDFSISEKNNFMFLTGANMAGKSTFIRAVGITVYLASIGMAVPADSARISRFDGLLSNIDISDNTLKGESYFYNEVQRINKTIDKITDGKNWLILIDELFKGTNIQDAMKCSTAVIEGFRRIENALFILSTHLYEIGDNLKQYPNIQFKYFETEVGEDDYLKFSYKLKDGISNDRLGYLILRREGVVQKLNTLNNMTLE